MLPILSLKIDSDHMYNPTTGIYTNPTEHGIAWERPVEVSYIVDGKQQFLVQAGIRIHGGASRARSAKKSFRLYFRSIYGTKKLKYPLFGEEKVKKFDKLVLRAGFNDSWGYDKEGRRGGNQRDDTLYVKDQVARDLHQEMGHLVSKGIFVQLKINDKDFGLYNIVERIDRDMIKTNHPELENITPFVISSGEVKEGGDEARESFEKMISVAKTRNYQEIGNLLDLNNFTDYMILHIWLQNYDWPRHNWYAYTTGPLDKWKFLVWDMEYSFGSGMKGNTYKQNTVEKATNEKYSIGVLFKNLCEIPEYEAYFWKRYNQLRSGVLSEQNIRERLDQQLNLVSDTMDLESARWGRGDGTLKKLGVEDWQSAIKRAHNFIRKRDKYARRYLKRNFSSWFNLF